MNDELTYPELWLLELSTKYGAEQVPLLFLPDTKETRRTGYCGRHNCPANGLSPRDLCDVLWRLFQRGEINFQSISSEPDRTETEFVPANVDDLLAKMAFEQRERWMRRKKQMPMDFRYHCYRVTTAGIERWEKYAIPNWDRYLGDFSGRLWEPGETVWSQSATTEEFAREIIDVYATDLFHPSTLHWETATITLHQPWTPFLGKELPNGVTLAVMVTEHEQRVFGQNEMAAFGGSEQFVAANAAHYRRCVDICTWYENDTFHHPKRPMPSIDADDSLKS